MARKQQRPPKKPAKSNIVSLTVHKNTLALKKLRDRKQAFLAHAKDCASIPKFSGYVVISFDDDGECEVHYDSGKVPIGLLPIFIHEQLGAAIERTRTETQEVG